MSIAAQASKRVISVDGIPLSGKVTNFYYYESLLSPYVTANFNYVDTGNSIVASQSQDTQGRFGTLTSSLPLENRNVTFRFENSLGELNYLRYPMKIDGYNETARESQREAITVRLYSQLGIENEKTRISKKFYNNIGDSVRKILKDELKVKSDRIKVTSTKNPYSFTGSTLRACDLCIDLASKSTPVSGGDPGFFFYETKSGVYFKSIDELVSQKPKYTYEYNQAFTSDLKEDSNAFRILNKPNKFDQSIIKSLRSGMYYAKFCFIHEKDLKLEERYYSIEQFKRNTLGKKFEFDANLKSKPSRVYTVLIPEGMMEKGISKNAAGSANDPREYLARSIMRYNLLFVQIMNIMIPCNLDLEAGDVIECKFEKITVSEKSLGANDERQSGKYLIMNLCHYFGTTNSYTSLTLVRDTYGAYTGSSGGAL